MSVSKNLEELTGILKEHIKRSNEDHLDVKQALIRLEVKADYAKETLDKHDKSIETLKIWRYITSGSILAAIGGLFK